MKKVALRYIIPTTCYAILFAIFALIAILAFAMDPMDAEALQDTGMIGLIVLFFAAAVKGILLLIGLGGSVMMLFPLVFSAVNIAKKGRKLTVACLVYDILLTFIYLPAFLASLLHGGVFIFGAGLALVLTALVTNAYSLKKGTEA